MFMGYVLITIIVIALIIVCIRQIRQGDSCDGDCGSCNGHCGDDAIITIRKKKGDRHEENHS